ncbi:MAG: sigma-70 family RNA polymerase sigma factor [Phycisphaerae bacterium]|nr:sigma-70 family RNA polymerase sigma factor [Phycisphaerae bacterium]
MNRPPTHTPRDPSTITPKYHTSPELLTAAALAGDRDALRVLWEQNRRWVAAILLAHKPAWADLDDLLQEVATSVVRHSGELRDPASFRSWLRTVAINSARLAARTRKYRPEPRPLAGDEPLASVSPAGITGVFFNEEREEGRRLLELAMELPEGYREPLLLKALRDLSYRQIGELVGLPETTVETRIARARKMLRELAVAPAASRKPESSKRGTVFGSVL